MAQARPHISISVVSHGQMALVEPLLRDLAAVCRAHPIEVILTLNLPETLPPALANLPYPLRVLRNPQPRGFGANHNAAAREARADALCVLNPDIRISHDPFPALLPWLAQDNTGIVAPAISGPRGQPEDSARKFPTPWRITHRVLTRRRTRDYAASAAALHPDWVGGMFMLLPTALYRRLDGFDERYFLYYEDVDLCARVRLAGLDIVQLHVPGVVHDAQRASHRDATYLRWHVSSMLRFFCSGVFWRLQWNRLVRGTQRRGAP